MKVSLSTILNAVCLSFGLIASREPIWIPVVGLVVSLIATTTRYWVASDRLGRAVKTSIILKGVFALIGFVAMFSQITAVGLTIYWLLTS